MYLYDTEDEFVLVILITLWVLIGLDPELLMENSPVFLYVLALHVLLINLGIFLD